MLFNILLLILLSYTNYKLSPDLAGSPDVSKTTITTLITWLVIPTGVLAFIGALVIKAEKKQYFSTALLIIMALSTVSFVNWSTSG